MRLKDRVAIVTGGSRGIGRAYALRLAQEGAKVVIADIFDGKETVEAIARQGGQAIYIRTDVTSKESTQEMARKTLKESPFLSEGSAFLLPDGKRIFLPSSLLLRFSISIGERACLQDR